MCLVYNTVSYSHFDTRMGFNHKQIDASYTIRYHCSQSLFSRRRVGGHRGIDVCS